MNLAELRATLTEWLTELEPWRGIPEQGPENYILTDEEYWRYSEPRSSNKGRDFRPDVVHVILFTERNHYHISAIFMKRGRNAYLGCTAHSRYFRPGEKWTRGNDLPDGPLSRKTWDAIINGILRYELQAMTQDAINVIKDTPSEKSAESVAV